jgi:hypothetical protein
MIVSRRTLLASAGASALGGALSGCATTGVGQPVNAATLERADGPGAAFVPTGGYANLPAEYDYVEEEYFASGVDDLGQPYKTQIFVRRPQDMSRYTGTVIVEPMHAQTAAPIFIFTARYIMRSGHGWACVLSQKTPLDGIVAPLNRARYASLHIGGTPGQAAPQSSAPAAETPEQRDARRVAMEAHNQASNAILAQAGAALKGPNNPFGQVRHLILAGQSQTGGVVTNYINNAHGVKRLPGGAPIYDGLMPTCAPRNAFAPRREPLIQVLGEGDIDDPARAGGRVYRRDDSDAPGDRYRLYELAGGSHMGTRYPPYNNPVFWSGVPADAKMSTFPHHELFNMALSNLVKWVVDGVPPPRAARIETGADGAFVKDEHGNSRGGVRCAQMDVPHLTYHPDPVGMQALVGTEEQFGAAKMRTLYGDPARYAERFNRRLDELIAQNWFLREDADGMRAEAAAQRF